MACAHGPAPGMVGTEMLIAERSTAPRTGASTATVEDHVVHADFSTRRSDVVLDVLGG